MSPRILVTGATGGLGSAVVKHLLAGGAPPSDIAGLARDPAQASNLSASGVEVRQGDYGDFASMRSALTGVERLLLVSATAFSDGAHLHAQVIQAARAAGVRHIVYTAIENEAAADGFVIDQVTVWDAATEKALADSGLGVTIARHSLYVDSLPFIIGDQIKSGVVRAPAGTGTAAVVLRDDLAEAHARLLLLAKPREAYVLTGSKAVSMKEVAASIGTGLGRDVIYEPTSVEDYARLRGAEGLPDAVTRFMGNWFEGFVAGAFPARNDLAQLLGREPRSALDWIESHYRSARDSEPLNGDDDRPAAAPATVNPTVNG